jgi:putative membrane protein
VTGQTAPQTPVVREDKPAVTREGHPAATPTRSERRLVKKIAAGNDYEIALSRQAVGQASNAQVRSYAETIVRDHERMNRELTALAARRGVMLPTTPRHYEDVTELSKHTGEDYDEAYVEDMIDAHEDAIDLLEKMARAKDPDLAAFAVQHLPALQGHLARARELDKLVD